MAMDFAYGDLYPNWVTQTTEQTSLLANPDKDDQQALNESETVADKVDTKSSRSFTVIIAIVLILLFVIFLGAK